MEGFSMDVDLPFMSKTSNLKRSNSAPMINALNPTTRFKEEAVSQPSFDIQPRARRFSASFSYGGLSPSTSPSSPCHARTPSRICQIKQEEGMDVANREVAHERKVRSAIQISQSCEDLTIIEANDADGSKRPRSFAEPLHILPSAYPLSSSPSPTRSGKQYFSPSMQQPVRNTSFCTSPVPSPTRKSVTRSLSPIALRPSLFPMKRKIDCGERMDCYPSPQKRFHSSSIFAPDRVTHSLSSSSLEDSPSPDQSVPISNANTLESMSSSNSPNNLFKPVDQDMAMQYGSEPPTPTSDTIAQDNSM